MLNKTISPEIKICLVTKERSVEEVKQVLNSQRQIRIIAENRYPDFLPVFQHFEGQYERHFIGRLQSNKIAKIVPWVEVIQSVDSMEKLQLIDAAAKKAGKVVGFCFQVNIAEDGNKQGLAAEDLPEVVQKYLQSKNKAVRGGTVLNNVKLLGLMTIGSQSDMEERRKYFMKMKSLFDEINEKFFKEEPLKVLSMGMSEDYELAIECGATMVRLGRIMFCWIIKSVPGHRFNNPAQPPKSLPHHDQNDLHTHEPHPADQVNISSKTA